MSRIAPLFVVLVIVSGMVNALAQEGGQTLERKAVKGRIVDIKPDLRTLAVAADSKEPITFRTNDETLVERNGMRIKLGDLKIDQIVMVIYGVNKDVRIAKSIVVESR